MSSSAPNPNPRPGQGRPDVPGPGTTFGLMVAAGLAVLYLGPLITPLPALPERVIHKIYVLFAGRQKAEDLRAAVEGGVNWESRPWISNSSLSAAVSSDAGKVAQTDGSELSCHSVAEVVSDAAEYQGFPIEFVAWVDAQPWTVSTEASAPIAHALTVEGPTRDYRVWVGFPPPPAHTPSFFPWQPGNIILIRGLVVATGIDRQLNGESIDSAYVVGLTVVLPPPEGSICVRSLVAAIEHKPH
jgi:hypothetical protein